MLRRSAYAPLIVCLGLGTAVPALAQTRHPLQESEIGAVGGLNSFTLAGSGDSSFSSRTTFYAGVAFLVPLSRNAFVEPQLVYAGKGTNARSTGMFGAINNAFRLNYVEVPVLVGLRFGTRVQPRVYAGPEVEFNINCELTATYISQPYIPNTTTCRDAGLVMRKIDAGVTGGVGVAFFYGRGTVSLEARYTLGLTSISTIKSVRNQGSSLGIEYTMPVGRF